jgi:hypothetical protein
VWGVRVATLDISWRRIDTRMAPMLSFTVWRSSRNLPSTALRPTACNQPVEVARTRKVHGLKRRLCAWLRFRGRNRGLKPDSNSQRNLMSAVDVNPLRCLESCEINATIACSLNPFHDLEVAIFYANWASNDRFVHMRGLT